MANKEYLTKLKQGVEVWNQWREKESHIKPDLSGADLSQSELGGIDLSQSDLREIDFSRTNLSRSNLSKSDLRGVDLIQTNLTEANLEKTEIIWGNLNGTNLINANLRETNLSGAILINANLRGINLDRAFINNADLSGADLSGANLSGADLSRSQFLDGNLNGMTLTGACIEDWNINVKTNLQNVRCDYIYLRKTYSEKRKNWIYIDRSPHNPDKIFAPGEFTKLFQKALETVDIIFSEGIEWAAFLESFQQLQAEFNSEKLSVQAIEKKSGGAFIVRVEVPPEANKREIQKYIEREYETRLKFLEENYQKQLEAKEEQLLMYRQNHTDILEIVKTMALRPINISNNYRVENSDATRDFISGGSFGIGHTGSVINNFNKKIEGDEHDSKIISAEIISVDEPDHEIQLVTNFLQQAGARLSQLDYEDIEGLEILDISGILQAYTPILVSLITHQPTDEDVSRLVKYSEQLNNNARDKVGIFFYHDIPDAMFRVRMTEVRLRDHFILIPIPFAAVYTGSVDNNMATGLLTKFVDRYMPGADLFDDRNAIGDTLSFFGRTALLHKLEEELRRNQGVGIFGLRKSGKTSLMIQLGFAMQEYPVVQIDLQTNGRKLRFGAELFNQIINHLDKLLRKRNPNAEVSFQPFERDVPAADLTTDFFRLVLAFAKALAESGYKLPILCFLDEVERILPTESDPPERAEEFNAFFGVLRALSQEARQLSLLIADVHPDCNRINQWNQTDIPTNPVFNFFKEVFLSPFSLDETKNMLNSIGNLMNIKFDEETLNSIYSASGGHPFVARQLGSLLYNKLATDGDKEIQLSKAERYLSKPFIYSGILKDYFGRNIWDDLKKRSFTSAIFVFRLLAFNENSEQRITERLLVKHLSSDFTESQCLDALLWLEAVGLIRREEVETDDFYKIQLELLARWLRMEMKPEEIKQWEISKD